MLTCKSSQASWACTLALHELMSWQCTWDAPDSRNGYRTRTKMIWFADFVWSDHGKHDWLLVRVRIFKKFFSSDDPFQPYRQMIHTRLSLAITRIPFDLIWGRSERQSHKQGCCSSTFWCANTWFHVDLANKLSEIVIGIVQSPALTRIHTPQNGIIWRLQLYSWSHLHTHDPRTRVSNCSMQLKSMMHQPA